VVESVGQGHANVYGHDHPSSHGWASAIALDRGCQPRTVPG